jgi:hypothetical protein
LNKTELSCTVCRKHKQNLRPRKSKLLDMAMFLCNDCFDKKLEPRFAVVIVARDPLQGLPVVADHLRNHRYHGDEITADELV